MEDFGDIEETNDVPFLVTNGLKSTITSIVVIFAYNVALTKCLKCF